MIEIKHIFEDHETKEASKLLHYQGAYSVLSELFSKIESWEDHGEMESVTIEELRQTIVDLCKDESILDLI